MKLTDFVTRKGGTWAKAASLAASNSIELSQMDDAVTFQGPLHLNISVVTENVLMPVNGGDARTSTDELFSYDLEIPAGFTWQYQMADSFSNRQLLCQYKVIIRPVPCVRPPAVQCPDLPCDFAVGNLPCVGEFFPAGCEPCGSGPVRMPPTCSPSLIVKPASGGCVRPRFFNGMSIGREDLETQLRYLRIKNKLQRRADGQGVVWGLGIGRDGSAVCVQPGYAVDCCGNDLTVTSLYKVDAASLLSDPAICNVIAGQGQCFHLLLEYIECPEAPRPVHGDPCFGATSACEMSRVRETVRLRLVRPRDYQPQGPIQRFLDTLSPANQPKASAAGPGGSRAANKGVSSTAVDQSFPYQLEFTVTVHQDFQGQLDQTTKVPVGMNSSAADSSMHVTDRQPVVLTFELRGLGDFSLSSGTVQADGTSLGNVIPGNDPPLKWQFTTPQAPIDAPFSKVFTIPNWIAGGNPGTVQAGKALQGSASATVSYNQTNQTAPLNISVVTQNVTLNSYGGTTPFPCLTDPCCQASQKPLFPVIPPWADDNPFSPGQAADPKVIVLSVIYALLAGTLEQNSSTGSTQPPPRVQAAIDLYKLAAQALDPGASKNPAELTRLTQAVQELLADWCCSFLYPGPTCEDEPHGVVIGCAQISDGQIVHVDPWSGRRWVMHYPLWSYWGAQFGLLPPDVLASRLFALICCLSGLPAPSDQILNPANGPGPSIDLPVGAGTIHLGALQTGNNPVGGPRANLRSETISLPIFAARTLAALAQPSSGPGTAMVDFVLSGFPNVHLLVADDSAPPTGPPPPNDPSELGIRGPVGQNATELVRQTLAAPEARSSIPPLLRKFAETLSVRLVAATPLSAVGVDRSIARTLSSAHIKTVGEFLERSPESLFTDVFHKAHSAALSELIKKAEAKVGDVTQAVASSLKEAAATQTLVSAEDISTTEARLGLGRTLAQTLRLPQAAIDSNMAASLV